MAIHQKKKPVEKPGRILDTNIIKIIWNATTHLQIALKFNTEFWE